MNLTRLIRMEREDILAALSYAARLTHVKRQERLAA